MRGVEGIRKARGLLLPVLVLALIAAFLVFAGSRFRTEFPVLTPRDGVLDARDVDFGADVYHIVNSWDYYPGRLLTPEQLSDPATAASKSDGPLDVVLGTWRLRILARPDTWLSLCSFSIDYSTRVFVNGQEVRQIGTVSRDPAQAVPMTRYVTLPLYTGETGAIEIVYQYANHIHNQGGFIQNTLVSTPENIDEYRRGITFYSLLLASGLLFLTFYFLLCASFLRSRELAALGLCCLVIALRSQFFLAEHMLGPGYDLTLEYRFMVLDVSWIPASAVFLLAGFYPKAAGGRAARVFAAVFAVLSALHFILPIRSLVLLCHVCYFACAPFAVLAGVRLARGFAAGDRPGPGDAVTLGAILYFIVMLIREGILTGSDATVNRFGLTPMTMVICVLLLAAVINSRVSRQREQLREARERNALLTRVNDMNRDFLRTVAHELKTPLTVISGYAQLIGRQLGRNQLSDKTPERLEAIRGEADRLAEMVTRLMEYTYGRGSEAEMGPVDLDALLESAATVLSPVCARRQNALTVRGGGTGPVHGNEGLLLQVLINLVVNASRHTESGVITVEAADGGDFAAVTVSDTGSGIAPEAVPHIFEKGYSTGEGRGLGLAICQDTVRMHGGALTLVSTGPGGTVFRFTVPKEGPK